MKAVGSQCNTRTKETPKQTWVHFKILKLCISNEMFLQTAEDNPVETNWQVTFMYVVQKAKRQPHSQFKV